MNQQRSRRFRSAKDAAELRESEIRKGNEVPDKADVFDSNWSPPSLPAHTLHSHPQTRTRAHTHINTRTHSDPQLRCASAVPFACSSADHQLEAQGSIAAASGATCGLLGVGSITPGTEFMQRLGEHLRFFVKQKVNSDADWQCPKIIFSGSEVPVGPSSCLRPACPRIPRASAPSKPSAVGANGHLVRRGQCCDGLFPFRPLADASTCRGTAF
jgi:5'-3' exonuclease